MWEQQLYIYFTKGSIQKQTFLTSPNIKNLSLIFSKNIAFVPFVKTF